MPKSIKLEDPDICKLSVSEQLRSEGILISDSNFRDSFLTIFQVFAKQASSYYTVVEQGTYEKDEDRKCGLCGNRELLTYYTAKLRDGVTLVTHHSGEGFGEPFTVTWPDRIRLGSHCVKMVGLPLDAPRMINSMLSRRIHYQTTPGGLIKIGNVIKNYEHWEYECMMIPHALFTRLPLEIMHEYNILLCALNNEVDVSECTQKSIQRSLLSKDRKAKYRISRVVYPDLCLPTLYKGDVPMTRLATYMSRRTAKEICNKYITRK